VGDDIVKCELLDSTFWIEINKLFKAIALICPETIAPIVKLTASTALMFWQTPKR